MAAPRRGGAGWAGVVGHKIMHAHAMTILGYKLPEPPLHRSASCFYFSHGSKGADASLQGALGIELLGPGATCFEVKGPKRFVHIFLLRLVGNAPAAAPFFLAIRAVALACPPLCPARSARPPDHRGGSVTGEAPQLPSHLPPASPSLSAVWGLTPFRRSPHRGRRRRLVW